MHGLHRVGPSAAAQAEQQRHDPKQRDGRGPARRRARKWRSAWVGGGSPIMDGEDGGVPDGIADCIVNAIGSPQSEIGRGFYAALSRATASRRRGEWIMSSQHGRTGGVVQLVQNIVGRPARRAAVADVFLQRRQLGDPRGPLGRVGEPLDHVLGDLARLILARQILGHQHMGVDRVVRIVECDPLWKQIVGRPANSPA